MANIPYEDNTLLNIEVPDMEINQDELTGPTGQEEEVVVPVDSEEAPSPELTPNSVVEPVEEVQPVEPTGGSGWTVPDLPKRSDRVEYFKGLKEARKLPHGDPGKDAWALANHGVTWDAYEKKMNPDKDKHIGELLKDRSILFNQEAMMSGAVGALDWATDLTNWVTRQNIPKIPKFEQEGAQAFREISSLVVPFYFLKGRGMGLGANIHKSGVAAPWLVRLGNNPLFSRFAKTGLDLGVGGFTDYINKLNETDDTLMTVWKRGRWWGHNLIPEAWMSDGLGPDDKTRANVLEGVTFGFYAEVAEGLVKLLRAGKSTQEVTKYLSEVNNQKGLDSVTIDPLDSKVYKSADGGDASPIEEALQRSHDKYERDLNLLTDYYKLQGDLPTTPTVGVHKIQDSLQTGQIVKDNDGILGVARRQAQIATNTGTSQGSLGTTITEAFRKLSTEPIEVQKRTLINKLRDVLTNAGPYKVELPNGKKLSWKQIDQEGTILAEILADPTLPRGQMLKILENFKVKVNDFKTINPVAYKALSKASIKLLDDWADLNTHKASAYFIASEGGQIAGISEGARYADGTTAVGRANELIMDRLELFEIETSLSEFNWKSRNSLLNALEGNPKDVNKKLKKLKNNFDDKLTDIIPKAKRFRETLSSIQENSPEFAKVLRMAYEMSEGDIQSIKGINNYIQNKFGTFSKIIYDGSPEIPAMVNKALTTNIFNSMLSAIGTPVRALTGNFGGLIAEPAHVFYGALRSGDAQQLRRASWMYFGLTDTFQRGFSYMGTVFRKAATEPDELGSIFRADIKLEKSKNMDLAEEIAAAAAKNNEFGPQALLGLTKELEAMGSNPVLRLGPNTMTALDGFTEATQKVAHDRGLAFDFLESKFPNGNWGEKEFQEAFEDFWKKGWDDNGTISQSAVEWSRREIALNLDTPLTKRLNPLLKSFPILRSVFWFPNTQMNVLDMFGKYGASSRVQVGTNFAGEYAELLGSNGKRAIEDFTTGEIQAALNKRGIDMSGDYISKFKHLRNKIRGREATGNVAVMGAWLMFTQDRIRGDGHWDRKTQRVRDNQGYVKRTYQGLDGKWHSYEFMGPLADWLALTINVMDNFNSVSTSTFEKFGKKMAFILGASLTDRSFLGNLEPMFNILGGNPQAQARWAGPLANSMFPLAGFRNEIGKVMFGMLREVEKGDISEMIRNRNNFLDLVDRDGALPSVVDYVTGKEVNKNGGTFFRRARNTYTPFKIYEEPTKEGQFLIDMEYSGMPHFNVSPGGIPYTTSQKEELSSLVGEDGNFNRKLKSIMRYATRMTFTTDEGKTLKGYVDIMSHLRSKGYTSEDLPEFSRVRSMLDAALSESIRRVSNRISDANSIKKQELQKRQKVRLGESKNIEGLDRLLQLNNSN